MTITILLLSVLVLFYAAVCLLFYVYQDRFLFKQKKFPPDYKFHYEYPFEELNWKTIDGNIINGLLFRQKNSRGVILFFHGNSGHMGRSGNYFKRIIGLPYDVLLYDYRGYGKSTGTTTTRSLYSDALVVFEWMKTQYKNSSLVLHGLSLGSHIAAYVASRNAVSLLILETPFCDLPRVAQWKYPYLPIKLLIKYNLRTSRLLPKISSPIHIFHGTSDTVVPLSEPKRIARIANAPITIVDGANHKNLNEFMLYTQTLKRLLLSVVS